MKRRSIIGLLAGITATHAYGFVPPTSTPSGVKVETKVLRPNMYAPEVAPFADDGTDVQLDSQSNAVRTMTGVDVLGLQVTNFTQKAFQDAALELVKSRSDVFGVPASDVRITYRGTLVDREDQVVKLDVYRNGIKISDAGITFRFKQGHLTSLTSETYAEAEIEPSLVSNTGDIAASAFNSHGYVARGSSWRVVATHAGYSLVKVDEYLVAGADAPWIAQVNTKTGELFEVRSKNMNLRGVAVAPIYPRYFGDALQDTVLPYATVSNSAGNSDERGEFSTTDSSKAPAMNGFVGQYAEIDSRTGSNLKATATKAGDQWKLKFDLKPAKDLWDNNDMAQAMVYVNINRIMTTAQKFITNEWLNEPLTANVNLSRHCNAYWDGETINFFTAGKVGAKTCANSGMIADVVFHEWGHGLHANAGGIKDGAMSEGYGDSMALLFTNDSRVGVDFFPIDHKPVRDMTLLKVYPKDLVGEVHADGQIFAGAMYDTYAALKTKVGADKARDLYAKYLFKGIYAYTKMTETYDAIVNLDKTEAGSAKAPNLCIINAAFSRHGLAKADPACGGSGGSTPQPTTPTVPKKPVGRQGQHNQP